MFDTKEIVQEATAQAEGVAKNVLVLARLTGISPKALAEGMEDQLESGQYYADFVNALVQAKLNAAKAEAKAEKEDRKNGKK